MAEKCPVCDGAGTVSRPPNIAGDQRQWQSSNAMEHYPCRACGGIGIIREAVAPFNATSHNPAHKRECDDCDKLRARDAEIERLRELLKEYACTPYAGCFERAVRGSCEGCKVEQTLNRGER